MPRYATGTVHGYSGELYGVSDHPSGEAAVEAFRASMKEMFPEVRLAPAGDFDNEGSDFVVRVADDFDLSASSISRDEIEDWIARFVTKPLDEDGSAAS